MADGYWPAPSSPSLRKFGPGDRLQGGVAIRAADGDVWVHPYLFRLVCSNGAIIARTLRTEHLEGLDAQDPDDAVRRRPRGCRGLLAAEVFADTLDQVRTAQDAVVDHVLTLLPLLARFSVTGNEHLLTTIMEQYFQAGDRSQFGLANAVTATARAVRNPDLREHGGIWSRGSPSVPSRPHPVRGRAPQRGTAWSRQRARPDPRPQRTPTRSGRRR